MFVRLLRFTILLSMLSVGLLTGCSSNAANAEEATPTPIPTPIVPTKPVYTVQTGDIVSALEVTGRIIPTLQQTVFFRVDGRIRKIYVKEGDEVKKDQILADLEVLPGLEREKSMQSLNLQRAEINVEMAKLELEDAKSSAITDHDKKYLVPMKQYQVDLAEIALKEVQLQNENLDVSIESAKILAPFDGKILNIYKSEGSSAFAYDDMVTVGDVTKLEVGADINNDQLQKLKEGMPIVAVPSDQPGQKITGTISRLPYPFGSGAKADSKDTMTRIALDVDLIKSGFKLGDFFNVSVIVDSRQNVLWLPPQAIRKFESRIFAIIQDGNIQRSVDIKIGLTSADRVEIVDGLKEGQVVILP